MAKAFMKHKFFHMEKLESQNTNKNFYMCPYCVIKVKNEKDFDDHMKTQLMKTTKKFLARDLLKYIPFSWSNTKKRTKHSQVNRVDHHVAYASRENQIEEKHKFYDEGKDLLLLSNDQLNNVANNNLPIKKRKIHEIKDGVQDESEKREGLEKIEVIKSEEKYLCRVFPEESKSYQELGGHIAHHGGRKHVSIEFGEIHQCCNCNKIFPKGQALGGHKKHCNKGIIISPPTPDDITLLTMFLEM